MTLNLGKNYGYVKYAESTSAKLALETLNGATICGNHLKVMVADPPKSYQDDGMGKRSHGHDDRSSPKDKYLRLN